MAIRLTLLIAVVALVSVGVTAVPLNDQTDDTCSKFHYYALEYQMYNCGKGEVKCASQCATEVANAMREQNECSSDKIIDALTTCYLKHVNAFEINYAIRCITRGLVDGMCCSL
ncbi:Tol-Pal system protein TolB [Frankliniella fusca]|uniref:Tol-Pal system protein TolB n=1 Tax=Frankliniella fusca TaxID=407009 RepID=A0AAE1H5I9_9NEOP|nr:Tol-Pal system protein TolB [Frankliniella fusca]